jgi:hypothetical protein
MSGAQLEPLDELPDDFPDELLKALLHELLDAPLRDELEELLDISDPLIETACEVLLGFVR